MTPELVAAHRQLDRAVDRVFGARGTPSDRERQALLFASYSQLIDESILAISTVPARTTRRTRDPR